MKSVQYGDFSGTYFHGFSPNTGKCGPEKTPYLDTFDKLSCAVPTHHVQQKLKHFLQKEPPEVFCKKGCS